MASDTGHRTTEALTGRVYKLVSPRDTVLGTITVPPRMADALDRYEAVNFLGPLDLPSFLLAEPGSGPGAFSRVGTLMRSYSVRGGVTLLGISIEEFEQLPGCAFAPGAAYLRSLLE